MDTSLAPFKQVLRKLCLFKPSQSRELLPGHCCSWENAPLKLSCLLAHTSNGSVLKHYRSSHHELRIAHGLTFMTSSPRGWEAFPTLRALAHIRITWVFSSSAPQVPGVIHGSPLCPWCFGHSLWRGAQHYHKLVRYKLGQVGNCQQYNIPREKVHDKIQNTMQV